MPPSDPQPGAPAPAVSPAEMMASLRALYASPEVVAQRLHAELDELAATIQAAQPHWNTVLPGREWTPAQEAEHTVMVNESTGKLARLLLSEKPIRQGMVQPGEFRDGKRVAPAGTEPTGNQSLEVILARNAASRELITVQAQANPERTFPHPFMGPLDALDWLRMAAYHTRHHRKAMQRGLQALDGADQSSR